MRRFIFSPVARWFAKFPVRSQYLLIIKFVGILICFGFALSGKPPAHGQSLASDVPPTQASTAEDIRQDINISYMKIALSSAENERQSMQLTIIKQGEDLARLDTKMTMFVSILGFLQTGGILLSLAPLKNKLSPRAGG